MSQVISRSGRSLIFKDKVSNDKQLIWKLCSPLNNIPAELANEFEITSTLNISNVRKPVSKGIYENKEAFAYEYFEGITVKQCIGNGPLSLHTFFQIAINIVTVLEQLHQAGILHLRINSNNILVNASSGKICLIDFSLASPQNKAKPVQFQDWENELAYISPEQTGYLRQTIDERSDLYALGIVLYEMLAGEPPFAASDSAALVHDHLIKIPASVKHKRAETPEVVAAIIDKLLVKKPENRYQTAGGLGYDLQKCYQQLTITQTINNFQPGLQDEQPLKLTDNIIGRHTVIASLNEALEQAMLGKNRLCLIGGEQGAGKTATIESFSRNIRNKNGIVFTGKSVETAVNLPYSAIVDAMKDLAAFILSQGENAAIPWKKIITKAVGDNTAILVDLIPEYSWIIEQKDEPGKADDNTTTRTNDFCALVLNVLKEIAATVDFVVFFIDDLQWTDADSWKCIRTLVSDEELRKFLFVGTYRNTDEGKSANALQNVDQLIGLKEAADNIALHNLDINDIASFLTQSMISDDAGQLSRLLLSRTLGNPFFLRQFLETLYKNKILHYNRAIQQWTADYNKAETIEITDNVINYTALKVKDLPAEAQDLLLYASCIGAKFDAETLTHISDKENHVITELLLFLQGEGFIEKKEASLYYFVHDRIRKAAYEMLPANQQALIHYKIAAFLHSQTNIVSPEKNFAVASHYNIGHRYIPQANYFTIAVLNLKAGLQAKQAAAFELSYEYLKAAIQLLQLQDWKEHYKTTLLIYNEATEAAMIAGAYNDADAWLKASLAHATTVEDRIKAHDIKLNHLSETHKFEAATAYLLEVLDEIGYGIKRYPGKIAIFKEFIKVKWLLRNKNAAAILHLPPLTNERAKAFIKLTVNALSSIFGTAPDILPIVIFRQAWLSLKYGNSVYSPYAYVSYGFALSAFMNDLKSGYQFGRLALQLADKLNAEIIKAKVLVVFYGFISYFVDPLRQSLAPLKEAYSIGRKTGDLLYAAFALAFRNETSLHCGEKLLAVLSSIEQDCLVVKEMNQDLVYRMLVNQLQLVYQLSHHVPDTLVFQYNSFDEAAYLNQLIEAKDNASIFNFYFSKLFLFCTFNKMEEAFKCYEKSRAYEEETTARQIFYGAFLMYAAMAIIKNSTQNAAGAFDDTTVKTKLNSLQRFARFAPVNYAGKLSFVLALVEEAKGLITEAETHFRQAIKHSQQNGFIHEEALAREHLAYMFFKSGNTEYGELMIQKAYTCYQRWGAVSKVDQLKATFSEVLNTNFTENNVNIASFQNIYDFNTVINANKALSSENSLEGLLKRVLEIVIQNASCDKAVVILKNGQNQTAKAIGSAEGIRVLDDTNKSNNNCFPVSLVNFVEQTTTAYSSDHLAMDKRFNYDAYIAKHQPVSACCIPICTKTTYLGAIYLENNFAEAVFDSSKVDFFKTIASQLAISLENVSLLLDMEQKVKEKTSQLTNSLQELKAAQAQLIQQEKMSYLGELTAGIAHEIQNPLNFVNNFSEVSSELLTEMNEELLRGDIEEAKAIAEDVKQNLEKITYHGKRADAIVKSMLQHSRKSTGQKELTDINALCDEYIRLSYHGLRAKDKSFNATFVTDFDASIDKINVIPQDISRVLLNLLNNAFYAVNEKQKITVEGYKPVVSINTKFEQDSVYIIVTDNGNGIPPDVIDKIFQPFFTTKPTGQGTGLGLSLSYDIVKAHSGEIAAESKVGEGSMFTVQLPAS